MNLNRFGEAVAIKRIVGQFRELNDNLASPTRPEVLVSGKPNGIGDLSNTAVGLVVFCAFKGYEHELIRRRLTTFDDFLPPWTVPATLPPTYLELASTSEAISMIVPEKSKSRI
ncbi:hypothetical protein Moror_6638 [Moniliophthora roreri MCA 2997]|uniref:Uncharacterized protein n=1 Tax=Moniliophthora roreri (strain MCA 2997) TaxID=1381753 RepID=V2XV71_MONRO|nr:hypothetical protein Moror_6638 [Moniliophthora roreri MCA 2997]